MQIRLFQTSDAFEVSNIILRNLREVNVRDYTLDELKTNIDYFTPEQVAKNAKIRTVFVAIDGEKVLGTAGFTRSNNPEMKGVFLLTVFIHPDHHSQGIGKKLVETTEDAVRNDEFKTMYVPSGRTAIGFYQKLGYDFKDSIPKEDIEGNTLLFKKL